MTIREGTDLVRFTPLLHATFVASSGFGPTTEVATPTRGNATVAIVDTSSTSDETSARDLIIRVFTRRPVPPGQLTPLKVLYEADSEGLTPAELARRMRGGDVRSLRSVLGALGGRVNRTLGLEGARPGVYLLVDCIADGKTPITG